MGTEKKFIVDWHVGQVIEVKKVDLIKSLEYDTVMQYLKDKPIWDYKIKQSDLNDSKVYMWYLNRKAQMADWQNLDKNLLIKNLDKLNISKYRKLAIKLYFT